MARGSSRHIEHTAQRRREQADHHRGGEAGAAHGAGTTGNLQHGVGLLPGAVQRGTGQARGPRVQALRRGGEEAGQGAQHGDAAPARGHGDLGGHHGAAKKSMESKNVMTEVLRVLNSADQATVADIFPYWRVQEAFKTEDVSNQQVKITVAINTLTRVLIQGVTVGQIRGDHRWTILQRHHDGEGHGSTAQGGARGAGQSQQAAGQQAVRRAASLIPAGTAAAQQGDPPPRSRAQSAPPGPSRAGLMAAAASGSTRAAEILRRLDAAGK